MPFGRVVHYLVEGEGEEVDPHVDEYRLHAGDGGADRYAGYAVLCKRGVHDPCLAELILKPDGSAEYTA